MDDAPTRTSAPPSAAAPVVLVVDDHAGLRRLICDILVRESLGVVEAGSTEEAFTALGRRQGQGDIALAIIDMIMPGASGLDLASTLEREGSPIKILYISGCHDSLAMDVIARRSPEAVLLKPFTESQLLERVRMLLRAGP